MSTTVIKTVLLICLSLPGLLWQPASAGVCAEDDAASDNSGLVYASFPQADLANEQFAKMVLRMADTRETLELPQIQRKADKSFAAGHYTAALRNYQRMAYYGDKFSHLRIGLMYIEGKPGIAQDVPRGMAWLALAMEEADARQQVNDFYQQQWAAMSRAARCQTQQMLDELVLRYSNLALMQNLNNYYDSYFRNRGGTNLKAAQSRVSASGVAASGLGGGYNSLVTRATDEFALRKEFQFVQRMLNDLGTVTLGDFELLDEQKPAPTKPSAERKQ